jgi:Lipoprotein LpqB beta-propeller domain/Sporulation and spore germination
MTPRPRGRTAAVVALLLALAALAGCASVPESSPVQVLRNVGEGDAPAVPPGPVEGSNPLDLVRGFVYASGSSVDRHGAARRFLAPEAEPWNDAAGLTVLDEQFDTVYAPDVGDPVPDLRTVRIRGTAIGRLTPQGAFDPDQAPTQVDLTVVRRDGQWRISRLDDGVLVRVSDFRANHRAVKSYFLDPVRRAVVPDLRYLPSVPARAQAARAMELLLAGPSGALQGAATSVLPPTARLRSNVAETPEGALIVDLTQVGDLDEPTRRLLAAQIVLSLAEVNVQTVRLLVDGEPLLAGRPDLTRDDVQSMNAEVQPGADVPALVVHGGRVRRLVLPATDEPVAGPAGDGSLDVESASTTADGTRLAVVVRRGGDRQLLVAGPEGVPRSVAIDGRMSRPSWTPSGMEVWTVLDGRVVARVLVDDDGSTRTNQVNAAELTSSGRVEDLRLSRDGLRVVAVVDGGLYTAAIARGSDGDVAIRNVRRLRADDLGDVVAADWRAPETVVAISRRAERPVSLVSADGLNWQPVPSSNLTPPLSAIAAAPSRPLLVTDQGGVWSFAGGELDTWRQVIGGVPDAVPLYPG